MRDRYDFSDSKPNPYAKRMERQIAIPSDLWCESATRRLRSARSLTALQLDCIHKALCEGCPVEAWPYGNATSINPLLVTLGPSPGGSPQAGDLDTPAHLELPPAGSPHPHVKNYADGRRYWDKVRHLARAVITPPDGSETDAYALFGNMNLDPARSGDASSVDINRTFAEWVLRTIKSQLRPRWLVCLGLTDKLRQDRALRQTFESIFELDLRKPDEQYQLLASRYCFREWEVHFGSDPLTVVLWPNHPSRHPFLDPKLWRGACEQFRVRHAERLGREI